MKTKSTPHPFLPTACFCLVVLCLMGYDLRLNRLKTAEVQARRAARDIEAAKDGTINVSCNDVLYQIEKQFSPLEAVTSQGGQTQYVAQDGYYTARIELTGDKSNLTRARLLVALPEPLYFGSNYARSERQALLAQNKALMLAFVKNTFPEKKGAGEWVLFEAERTAQLHRKSIPLNIAPNDKGVTRTEKGDKVLLVSFDRKQGMVEIVVQHK